MIEQQARVVSLGDGKATVTTGAVAGCPACDAGKGCGAGIFARLAGRRPVTLELRSEARLAPGQAVTIGIPEALFLRLLFRLYFLPLLAGLGGAVAGHYLGYLLSMQGLLQDLFALTGALIFAAVTQHFLRSGSAGVLTLNPVQLLRCSTASSNTASGQQCRAAAD